MKKWIKHFHLEDISPDRKHEHLMLGDGAMDIPNILRTISDIPYRDFITIELYPYQANPVDTAKKTYEYLSVLEI